MTSAAAELDLSSLGVNDLPNITKHMQGSTHFSPMPTKESPAGYILDGSLCLLTIAGRRAAFILRTEGPVQGLRRIAGGVRRRAGRLVRR